MYSFQAKIHWKKMRKGKNKNYRSVPFRSVPTRLVIENSKTKAKKQQKNLKIPLWHHFKPKQVGKGLEKEKIKILVPLCSYPTQNRKFQKNSKNIQKVKKYHFGSISSQNWLENAEKERI